MAFNIRLQDFGTGFNISLSHPFNSGAINGSGTADIPVNASSTGEVVQSGIVSRGVIRPTFRWAQFAKKVAKAAVFFAPIILAPKIKAPQQTATPRGVVRPTVVDFSQFVKKQYYKPKVFAPAVRQGPAQQGILPLKIVRPIGFNRFYTEPVDFPRVRIITREQRLPVRLASGNANIPVNAVATATLLGQGVGAAGVPVNALGTGISIIQGGTQVPIIVEGSGTGTLGALPGIAGRRVIRSQLHRNFYTEKLRAYKPIIVAPSVRQGFATLNASGVADIPVNAFATGTVIGNGSGVADIPVNASGTGTLQVVYNLRGIIRPVTGNLDFFKKVPKWPLPQVLALRSPTTAIISGTGSANIPVNAFGTGTVTALSGISGRGIIRSSLHRNFFTEKTRIGYKPILVAPSVRSAPPVAINGSGTASIPVNASGTGTVVGIGTLRYGVYRSAVDLFAYAKAEKLKQFRSPILIVGRNVTANAPVGGSPVARGLFTPRTHRGLWVKDTSPWYYKPTIVGPSYVLPAPQINGSGSATVPVNAVGTASGPGANFGQTVRGLFRSPVSYESFIPRKHYRSRIIAPAVRAPQPVAINGSGSANIPVNASGTGTVVPIGALRYGVFTPAVDLFAYAKADKFRTPILVVARNATANAPVGGTGVATIPVNASGTGALGSSGNSPVARGIVSPRTHRGLWVKDTSYWYYTTRLFERLITAPLSTISGSGSATIPVNASGTGTVRIVTNAPVVTVTVEAAGTAQARITSSSPVVTVTPNAVATAQAIISANGSASVPVDAFGYTGNAQLFGSGVATVPVNASASGTVRIAGGAVADVPVNAFGTGIRVSRATGEASITVEASGQLSLIAQATGQAIIPVDAAGTSNVPAQNATAIATILVNGSGTITTPINGVGSAIITVQAVGFGSRPVSQVDKRRIVIPAVENRVVVPAQEKRIVTTLLENRRVFADSSAKEVTPTE